jgi:biopolymer transport protein TolR
MAMNLPSGRSRHRRAPVAEINVTPLVDVMLVLLIIFMVTAPLLSAGVPVNLPDSRAKPLDQPDDPVEISLDTAGRIYLGETATAIEELPQRLAAIAARATDAPPQVFVRADKSIPYGRVMEVMGELNRAGLNKVSLVTIARGDEAQ